MGIYRSYFSKNNTLVKDSRVNTARNPVFELLRGTDLQNTGLQVFSRYLFDIDMKAVAEKYANGELSDNTIKSHKLKIRNVISGHPHLIGGKFPSEIVRRDSWFRLMLFRIPQAWNEGTGNDFDYSTHVPVFSMNTLPSNWEVAEATGKKWETPGIYDASESLLGVDIIDIQTFYAGDEDIEFDITAEINRRLKNPTQKVEGLYQPILKDTFIAVDGQTTFMTSMPVKHVINVTLNGISMTLDEDFSIQGDNVIFFYNLLNDDRVYIQYVPNLGDNGDNGYVFTVDKFYWNEPGVFDLNLEAYLVYDVELNGVSMVEGEDFNLSPDKKQIIFLHGGHVVDADRIVVKYYGVGAVIEGEMSHGYGIAYLPVYENAKTDTLIGVSFYSKYTNTFFRPFVETLYDDEIRDDRFNFIKQKKNRLYLSFLQGNDSANLDSKPSSVDILNGEGEVVETVLSENIYQQGVGLYYIEVRLNNTLPEMNMYHDVWKGLVKDGEILDDVEHDFILKPAPNYFQNKFSNPNDVFISPNGINHKEKIKQGERRRIFFTLKELYSKSKGDKTVDISFRIFVLQGNQQIEIMPFTKAAQMVGHYYSDLDTTWMIPQRYYMEIVYKLDGVSRKVENVLEFDVVSPL